MKKLYRSRRDKKLFGICGGLADLLNTDSTLIRVLFIVTTFFTGGALIPIYIFAALVIPNEPAFDSPLMSSWNPYGVGPQPYSAPHGGYGYHSASNTAASGPSAPKSDAGIDHMMQDIESKALRNEIEQLKAKLAKYEKGDV